MILFIWYWNCLPSNLFKEKYSTIIYANDGSLIAGSIAEDQQWRFPIIDSVPKKFEQAILQFEDRNFYSHIGISARGLGRAIYQNIKNQKVVSGGSTITMQLMRMTRGKKSRNLYQKIIEMIWASRFEISHSKKEILKLYVSHAPMGGNIVGLEAASWRYFGRSPHNLSWAESAMLAVLPNAPSLIHPGKNRKQLLKKRNRLLKTLFEKNIIEKNTYELSIEEPLPEKPLPIAQLSIHLLQYALQLGYQNRQLKSSINYTYQTELNKILNIHHEQLKQNHIYNAAAIIINIKTNKILAYSANVENADKEHSKDVDCIQAPRSSGSILKPILYAEMMNDGLITPYTIFSDIPTNIYGYRPENYNKKYEGVVKAHHVIARSLNIPSVLMLRQYSIQKLYDDFNNLGFTSINRGASNYGLSLILGGAETKLFDLVDVYTSMAQSISSDTNIQKLAHQKIKIDTKQITDINRKLPSKGSVFKMFEAMLRVQRPNDDLNWQSFSSSQKIAWKTGTSFGFRDAWAIGLSENYAVGVWVGNADGEGRPQLVGVKTAGPILFDIFGFLPQGKWFEAPSNDLITMKICLKSGYKASGFCNDTQINDVPIESQKTISCPYHKQLILSKDKKYRVHANCEKINNTVKDIFFVLPPTEAWYYQKYHPTFNNPPPYRPDCTQQNISNLSILYPLPNSKIYIPTNTDGDHGKIVLEASIKQNNSILHWHLDDYFIGKTENKHQMEVYIKKGKHILTIIDSNGNEKSIDFEVDSE